MAGEDVLNPGSRTPPVNPTGERTRWGDGRPDRGYKGNIFDIIFGGSADPAGPGPVQPWDFAKLGMNRLVAGGADVLAEAGGGIADAVSGVNEWANDPRTLPGTAKDFIQTGAMAFGHQGPQPLGGKPNETNAQGQGLPTAQGDPLDKTDADIDALFDRANNNQLMDQRLQGLLEEGQLDEQARFAIEEARAALADETDQIQLDLEKAKYQLGVQDVLFNFQAEQVGFDHDLAPLEEALEREGGVGLQTMQAIKDIAGNAAMDLAEKNEAIDLVMARAHFSDAMVDGISEMVQNRDDLIKLNEMADTELAGHLGVDKFFNPTFGNVIETDPVVRQSLNFLETVEQGALGDWLIGEATDQQYELFLAVRDAALQAGDAKDPALDPQYQALAQASGIDYTTWRDEVGRAVTRAVNSERAAEAASEARNLEPYSEAMTYAIANAGQGLIEAGVDPEAIRLIANYPGLHAIIKAKSQGRAGGHGQGTIRGVGGLTEDMYLQLMGEEWNPNQGMEWELQALLLYIMRGFGGDPMAAMDFYRKTESWGGVNSMGGEPSEQTSGSGE